MISKQFFFCFWSIICVLGLNGVTEAKVPRDIAQQAFPSVVMLVMEDDNGQPLSLGSGFFVREDIVATNLHVVEGSMGGYAKIVGQKSKHSIAGYVAIDERWDLILLKIKDANAPALSLGDSSKIAVGDEIFAVGNPKGLEGTFSKGIVSAIRKIEEDTLLQITAPISPGSSGGPVLNTQGEVVGVAVATFKGGQNLNFAIPVSYLSNLLTNTKSAKPLSVKEKPEKEVKSILNDLGGRSTEGVTVTNFTWSHPIVISLGQYSLSFQNKLREPVRDIQCLIIFYDKRDEPIDIDVVQYNSIIPGKLAKRVKGNVDSSVQELTYRREFRILSFQIVEESEDVF